MPRLYVTLAAWLVLLMPALALTSPVGGPAVLYLSALIALTAITMNAVKRYEPMDFRALWPLSLALLSPLACLLITSAVKGMWSSSELEKLLRFALALPVLWLLLRAPQRLLRHIEWTILAGALAVVATWLSETRSSWMLLPILGLVFLLGLRNWRRRHKVYCALAVCVALVASAAAIWTFSSRMQQITHDVQGFSTSANRDTSFGIRLQLWHASFLMFEKSPIVGIGPSRFREELRELQKQGIVTQEVVDGFGEPHNDLLAAMAGYGLLGLLSMLALYLVPAGVFFRRLASDDRVIRVGAQMGLLFCLSYCAFSMTEMMFRNMRSVPTYALIMVALIALTTARPQRIPPPGA